MVTVGKAKYPTWSGVESINKLFPHWQTAPLFMYDEPETEAETTAIVKAYERDIFEAFPFPVFRIDVTVGEKDKPNDWGKYKAKALVASYPDGATVLARVDGLLHTEETYKFYGGGTKSKELPIYMLVSGVRQSEKGSSDFLCNTNVLFGVRGKWLEEVPDVVRPYLNGMLKSIAAFNAAAMAPTNHIAEVHPVGDGRSVEWVKSRTHYTLITHGHPANKPEVKERERVTVNQDEELKRMCGNRRGHWRRYKHQRYTYARGQKRWVKATWCGPKEWMDEGGKQIYKILEPSEWKPENEKAA